MTAALAMNRRDLFSRWTAQRSSPPRRSELVIARRAMACEFSVSIPACPSSTVQAGCAALDEVERIERKLSVYQEESEISLVNRSAAGQAVRPGDELYRLLRHAAQIGAATGGAFDCTTGVLVKSWGFYRGPRRVPSTEEQRAALAASGWQNVRFEDANQSIQFTVSGLELNLGAIGKGYAIDQALDVLRLRHGVQCALMQGGQSSVKAIGAPPGEPRGWVVDVGGAHGARIRLRLRDRALGTSSSDSQFFVHQDHRYGHVLDPRTGVPAGELLSASAISATATDADALSTAFFVMGSELTQRYCREHPEVGAVLVAPGTKPRIIVEGAVDAEVLV
jgi:FAD:protein FMN transferase